MSKHPELTSDVLSPGVTYAVAYSRLEIGWDFARAVSEQPRKRASKKSLAERLEMYATIRAKKAARVAKRVLVPRYNAEQAKAARVAARAAPRPYVRRTPYSAEDTSPVRIQRIRAAFCEHFIRTGEIDVKLQQQLKDYANECRAASKHPERVPAEPPPARRGRPANGHGDHGLRDARHVDGPTAERIADFLRL